MGLTPYVQRGYGEYHNPTIIEILCATVKEQGERAGDTAGRGGKSSIWVDGRTVVGLKSSKSELAVDESIRS